VSPTIIKNASLYNLDLTSRNSRCFHTPPGSTRFLRRGDTPRIEDDWGSSWKRLRSSPGLARDDDDDDDEVSNH